MLTEPRAREVLELARECRVAVACAHDEGLHHQTAQRIGHADDDWNPSLYMKFADERMLAARDLLARVPLASARVVYDLGCGPGNSAELLSRRFPEADITGLDTSAQDAHAWQERTDKASIAVLPFTNMSSDPEQEEDGADCSSSLTLKRRSDDQPGPGSSGARAPSAHGPHYFRRGPQSSARPQSAGHDPASLDAAQATASRQGMRTCGPGSVPASTRNPLFNACFA